MGYFDKEQESITLRNAIAQVLEHNYPELIQSYNWKKFINNIHHVYLAEIEVKHLYGSLYYPRSQGAVEAFNKTVQWSL